MQAHCFQGWHSGADTFGHHQIRCTLSQSWKPSARAHVSPDRSALCSPTARSFPSPRLCHPPFPALQKGTMEIIQINQPGTQVHRWGGQEAANSPWAAQSSMSPLSTHRNGVQFLGTHLSRKVFWHSPFYKTNLRNLSSFFPQGHDIILLVHQSLENIWHPFLQKCPPVVSEKCSLFNPNIGERKLWSWCIRWFFICAFYTAEVFSVPLDIFILSVDCVYSYPCTTCMAMKPSQSSHSLTNSICFFNVPLFLKDPKTSTVCF